MSASARPAVERVHPPDALIRLANPVVRRVLRSPRAARLAEQVLILHFTGRRTGRHYDVPAGYHVIDGRPCVLTNSSWRANFRGGRTIEVTLQGRRRRAHATVIEDPDTVGRLYADVIQRLGVRQAQRRLGIRINVDRTPRHAELVEAVRRSRLSIVELDLDAGS